MAVARPDQNCKRAPRVFSSHVPGRSRRPFPASAAQISPPSNQNIPPRHSRAHTLRHVKQRPPQHVGRPQALHFRPEDRARTPKTRPVRPRDESSARDQGVRGGRSRSTPREQRPSAGGYHPNAPSPVRLCIPSSGVHSVYPTQRSLSPPPITHPLHPAQTGRKIVHPRSRPTKIPCPDLILPVAELASHARVEERSPITFRTNEATIAYSVIELAPGRREKEA